MSFFIRCRITKKTFPVLIAKLGRENVCSLVKGEIETPNDISGVVYVPMDEYGAWKNEVSKELKACDYVINNVF